MAILFFHFIQTPVQAQDAVFTNSGTFTSTSFVHCFPVWPLPTGNGTSLQLGYNYTPFDYRFNVYGGGIRNSWHKTNAGAPWMTWQEQMRYTIRTNPTIITTSYSPGIRYLANRHNWAGYQASFGLRESVTTYQNNPEGPGSVVGNDLPKDAVISFSYPKSSQVAQRSRLIFEKIELDTTNMSQGDVQTELATLTEKGNLGFRIADPSARIDINGNQGLANNMAIRVKNDDGSTQLVFYNHNNSGIPQMGYMGINTSNPSYNMDIIGTFHALESNMVVGENDNEIKLYYDHLDLISPNVRILGKTKSLLETKDDDELYFSHLKNATQGLSQIWIDNNTGKIIKIPAQTSTGNYWGIAGNSFPGPATYPFGTIAGPVKANIGIIVDGIEFGRIYGMNPSEAGLYHWWGSYAIGGDRSFRAPAPDQNITLQLMGRTTSNSWINAYTPAGSILKLQSQNRIPNTTDQINLFEIVNSGQTFIGNFQGNGNLAKSHYSMLNITYESDHGPFNAATSFFRCVNPSGDDKFIVSNDGDLITTGNIDWTVYGLNSILDVQNQQFIWDGDILPFVNSTGSVAGNNLGNSSFKWNEVWAKNGTIQTSDLRFKKNIINLNNTIEIVKKLRPVNYNWKDGNDDNLHYGFVAQELKEIFPNAVVYGAETDSTSLGVNYSEIIPILTKAIQEQQIIIENQNREIELIKAKLPDDGKLAINTSNEGLNKLPVLFQNTPNPFDKKTFIDYYIPKGTLQASIVVADATGKLVYSSTINTIGMGRVILDDISIAQGTYFYTLYVNNKLIDTKQMLVVKN